MSDYAWTVLVALAVIALNAAWVERARRRETKQERRDRALAEINQTETQDRRPV